MVKKIEYQTREGEKVIIEGSGLQQYYVENVQVQKVGETLAKAVETANSIGGVQVASKDSSLNILILIYFNPSEEMKYEYDSLRFVQMQSQYKSVEILNNKYIVPYKAVATKRGRFVDYVKAKITDAELLKGLQFKINQVLTTHLNAEDKNYKKINVASLIRGEEQKLQAVYKYKDTYYKKQEELLDKLKVIACDKKIMKMYIIPVGDPVTYNQSEINRKINQIYSQAVIEWQITWLPAFATTAWDINNDGIFDDTDPDNSMDYNPALKALIEDYKRNFDIEKLLVYIFFSKFKT